MEIMEFHKELENFLLTLQEHICSSLEKADGSKDAGFVYESWKRKEGGGGRSALFSNGKLLEKGGVNFSAVWGKAPEFLLREKEHSTVTLIQNNPAELEFYATGLSLVIHPYHPFIPIIHMNIRYFETSSGEWWLGGGMDITPHYVIPEQARWFHLQMKKVCDSCSADFYSRFKKWADDYFYLPHRNETRGVGGIFFDRLNESCGISQSRLINFWKELGRAFVPVYTQLIEWNKNTSWSAAHKEWQKFRSSRYVEFNLLYDKGTRFGIETGARAESVLMSLPPETGWKNTPLPEQGTEEYATLSWLKKDVDWINLFTEEMK